MTTKAATGNTPPILVTCDEVYNFPKLDLLHHRCFIKDEEALTEAETKGGFGGDISESRVWKK